MSLIKNGEMTTCASHIYMKVLPPPCLLSVIVFFVCGQNSVESLVLFLVSPKLTLEKKEKKKIDIEMIIKRSCLNAFDCSLMGSVKLLPAKGKLHLLRYPSLLER